MNNLTIDPKEKLHFPKRKNRNRSYYSSKGLKIMMIFGLLLFSISVFAQNDGDYRSKATGNWDDPDSWEVYDSSSSSWVDAKNNVLGFGEYPGEISGSYDAAILGGDTIALGVSITGSFNSLTVGDGTGSIETLTISDTSSLPISLLTIGSGGLINWTKNVTFSLPSGAGIIIETGGDLNGSPCSAAKRIVIGSVIISTCNGGAGAIYDFDELIAAGGVFVSDLNLEKTVDKVNPNIGDAITFTIVVTNNGPDSVSGASVKDILQPGLSYVSNTATAGSYISATGIWDFTTEILVVGDTETLTITATIDPNCDEILNRAEIISSNLKDTDSTPNNGG